MVAPQSEFPPLANPDNKIRHFTNKNQCYDDYFIEGETAEYFYS